MSELPAWRKSSFCASGECVEVGGWRKPRRSFSNGNCVEVGQGPAVVGVRDTKLAASPVLKFGGGEWARFLAEVKRGD